MPLYVDIHILQDVPPSNINRDDNGSPKQAVYGGVDRLRVSSQAWKRATRLDFEKHLGKEALGVRTRRLSALLSGLVENHGVEADRAAELVEAALIPLNITESKRKTAELSYLLFASRPQLDEIASTLARHSAQWHELNAASLQTAIREVLDVKAILGRGHSLDVALFGRMVADMTDLNVDAAAQVAHALSTHAAQNNFDYFTAVDDEQGDDEMGAGMIGLVEYSSATLYRYATVGVNQLIENLGDTETAVAGVADFIRSFACSMPSGHQNAFAPRTRPGLVAVVIRDDQPVNLVTAFEKPVGRGSEHGGQLSASVEALAKLFAQESERWGDEPILVAASYINGGEDVTAAFGPSHNFDDLLGEVRQALSNRVG